MLRWSTAEAHSPVAPNFEFVGARKKMQYLRNSEKLR
jgi:hypothetical protein